MKSLLRIYRRYIFSAAWIALAVIGVNLAVFGAVSIWLNRMGAEERFSGNRAQLERISAGFSFDGQGKMTLGEEEGRILEQSGCVFAFLLNDEGDRIWGWRVPEEIGEHFTAGEVAAFSRWYLEDYPVRVWNSGAGLLVLAQKKGSVGKYPVEISVQTLQNTPFMALALIAANLCLVLVFAVLAGYRLCRISVRDDGCGIPLPVRQSLEGEKEGGSAVHIMGLRIVMQIAAAHGGQTEFSQDGREVALYLPMAQGEGFR